MEFDGVVEVEQRAFGGGIRWPRQETMALLNLRSEMDAAFRDSSLKAPLWEEISRKMLELGYNRNGKKCREKFDNLFKYHKRTKKEGRSSKSEGKTYKFFDQLAALENITPPQPLSPSQSPLLLFPPPPPPRPTAAQMQIVHADPISVLPPAPPPPTTTPSNGTAAQPPHQQQNYIVSSSTTTSSLEDVERKQKRKRKEELCLREMMKSVIEKQEEFQKKFLEILEEKERERKMREEAWRHQEMEMIKKEFDLLAQERSLAEARHSTLVSLLENMINQQNKQNTRKKQNKQTNKTQETNIAPIQPPPPPGVDNVPSSFADVQQLALALLTQPPPPAAVSPPRLMLPPPVEAPVIISPPQDHNGGEECSLSTQKTSSRWPKAEIEALIKVRTNLDDNKYKKNGPKGALWKEVSIEMNKIGYNRCSKVCKQKWENINKYFKKVKDTSKKIPETSTTCSYFPLLDVLYKEKGKSSGSSNNTSDLNYPSYANAVICPITR